VTTSAAVPRFVLVRHSQPEIVPGAAPSLWRLSVEGRRRCRALADKLLAYAPEVVLTSIEPKAQETAELIATQLRRPCRTVQGLHEHLRDDVGLLGATEFEQAITRFFSEPATRVIGPETADAAHARFSEAVSSLLTLHPHGSVAVVAHGTVITLLVSRANGLEPLQFWKRLGLPSLVVLTRPSLRLVEIVE
jgi:broad specificity phosphatase PhoE